MGGAGFLEVDGVRLEAEWIGPPPAEAPTLVLLHEGLGSVSLWRDFPARLAAATGCGALVYSRRGYGRSEGAPLPRGVDFMHREAEVLERVLEVAGVMQAIPVGHSDGASIALIHAASHGEGRVRGLILEAPHVFVEEVTVRSIAALPEAYRTGLARALRRHHHEQTDATFEGWTGIWLDPAFRAWSLVDLLPAVRAPVLVIQGEDDEYGTLRQVEAIREGVRGPVSTLVLPRCGHSPHRDHPDAVLSAMSEFVGRLLG